METQKKTSIFFLVIRWNSLPCVSHCGLRISCSLHFLFYSLGREPSKPSTVVQLLYGKTQIESRVECGIKSLPPHLPSLTFHWIWKSREQRNKVKREPRELFFSHMRRERRRDIWSWTNSYSSKWKGISIFLYYLNSDCFVLVVLLQCSFKFEIASM